MKNSKVININKITSDVQKRLNQGLGAVYKSADAFKKRTGQAGREGAKQLAVFQKKSKQAIRNVFRKVG